jgi:Uma2 family endonuclease
VATLVQKQRLLTIEEHAQRWDEVVDELKHVPLDGWIVETNAYGEIEMFPLPEGVHQNRGKVIADWMEFYFPEHLALYERPVATDIGTRNADVVLVAPEQKEQAATAKALRPAPVICVEIWSPSNTQSEMEEKRDAYLRAGAREVWLCDLYDHMTFFTSDGALEQSRVCPEFPKILDLYQKPIKNLQQQSQEQGRQLQEKDQLLLTAYDLLVRTPEDRLRLEKSNPELVRARDKIVDKQYKATNAKEVE